MKIENIYIACYKGDERFTRALISSIRYWYPEIPISLLKDESNGRFDTSDIEKYWNVAVLDVGKNMRGFQKIAAMFLIPRKRVLYLDSDIVFVGPVLELLEQYSEDFIVAEEEFAQDQITSLFFKEEALKEMDSSFTPPSFRFNAGQLVFTSGLLKKEDFSELVDWDVPAARYTKIFSCIDQGVLNYVLLKKAALSEISLRRVGFRLRPTSELVSSIQPDLLTKESPYKFILHWAGCHLPYGCNSLPRYDIFSHFEEIYYKRIRFGWIIKLSKTTATKAVGAKILLKKCIRIKPITRIKRLLRI